MNRKFIVAILLVVAVPEFAQAQKPWITKGDAVVTISSGEKAKTQTYCEIQNLSEQMERAYENRSNEPTVHRCYFAGRRRTGVRTCSKPEGR
jgi:hypothetical protein